MAEFRLTELARMMSGDLNNRGADFKISHYDFDSRNITCPGSLFFALRSEQADGHRYVERLKKGSRIAAVVSRDYRQKDGDIPLIRVTDPLRGAQLLAKKIRQQYSRPTYIGITGSIGKTTVKEFCYQILSFKNRAFRSPQNWNNWIGVPFSIMMMKGDEDFAVFELAMSSPGLGEIDALGRILKPNVALLLNVCPVHLEFLKSLENVARAKMEIFNHLDPEGAGFINGDFEEPVRLSRRIERDFIYFGRHGTPNQVRLTGMEKRDTGYEFTMEWRGTEFRYRSRIHNPIQVENLFTAVMTATHLGMLPADIQQAVEHIRSVKMRGTIREIGNLLIIDETYNSNPRALQRNLEWVAGEYRQRKKVAVLGDMLELGEGEKQYHLEAGRQVTALGYDYLLVVGGRALDIHQGALDHGFPESRAAAFADPRSAARHLKQILDPGEEYVVLLKASRGIGMEAALQELIDG
jgi:UDP-N-acetylmuramoyl-tripeptide--D-alanyl-D-alanine ligase